MPEPITPTMAPLAAIASRTLACVAPSALSIPSARRRRCAITVNPATATKPMKTKPSTATARTIVAGEMRTSECEEGAGYDTLAAAGRP